MPDTSLFDLSGKVALVTGATHGLGMAMANGLGLGAVGKAIFPYPTRGEYLRRLADHYNRTRLTPLAKRLMKTWFRWRG